MHIASPFPLLLSLSTYLTNNIYVYIYMRTQNKKVEKDNTRIQQLLEIKTNTGPNLREIELNAINIQLLPLKLIIKEVISDGNCLFRAIADQLHLLIPIYPYLTEYLNIYSTINNTNITIYNYILLRKIASRHISDHFEEYGPFLGFETRYVYT